nr:MFS transporter [Bacillus sp. OVS6]
MLFLSVGSLQFLNLYYLDFGLSKAEIGVLFGVGPLIMICSQPLFGFLTDYWDAPKRTLFLTLLGSAITVLFYPLSMDFEHLLILTIIYSIFQSAVIPIADSTALELLQERNDFGKIRLWGSLGYALGVILIGKILDLFGLPLMFVLHCSLLLLSLLLAISLPIKKGQKSISNFLKP